MAKADLAKYGAAMIKIEKGVLAILSDIHGNLDALRAVVDDAERRAEPGSVRYCSNGDCVALGPEPRECLELLRSKNAVDFVMGNNERYVIERPYLNGRSFHTDTFAAPPEGFVRNLEWTAGELGPDLIAFAKKFEKIVIYRFAGKTICVSHGSPLSDEDIVRPDAPESEMLEKFGYFDYYVFGHTHRPFVRTIGERHYINAGSVGAPVDRDVRAAYLAFELSGGKIGYELRRVGYDLGSTVEKMRAKKVPWSEALIPTLLSASMGM